MFLIIELPELVILKRLVLSVSLPKYQTASNDEQFEKAYPEAFKANVKMPPAGHYGDAELEIGRVCVQLASPDFKYMNGETLTLEGGMGLRP